VAFVKNSAITRLLMRKLECSWRTVKVHGMIGTFLTLMVRSCDLVLKNKYKKAIDIGTSTGLSAIWIAWALSKTGGKLITIEIDEGRHKKAIANFEEAGLSEYIDARLADAHELVKELKGPFDFVFSDADKGWYKNYFIALAPKLEVGGCFTAHNATNIGSEGIRKFIDYVKGLPHFKTTIDTASRAGISISYKIAEK
jgi:caffeoyl-CoA O-methyltransferase